MEHHAQVSPAWTGEDHALLRHLVHRYGVQELISLLQRYGTPSPSYLHDPAMRTKGHDSRGYSGLEGVGSRASIVSNASSGSLFSEVSSVTGSTGYDTIEQKASAFRQRHERYQKRVATRTASRPPSSRSSRSPAAIKEIPHECPFCSEAGISRTIARKSDLKRHFLQFHHTNTVWICSLPNCGMVFDWKSAYEMHLKSSHQGIHREELDIKTCPQVVFGCGFSSCKQVYEAASDADADSVAAKYFAHVADHLTSADSHQDWSYTGRLRNLMRQSRVDDLWKSRTRNGDRSSRLVWDLHSSSTVRKMLETRHFPDIGLLVHWVAILGSGARLSARSGGSQPPQGLAIPERQFCSMVALGHCQEQRFISGGLGSCSAPPPHNNPLAVVSDKILSPPRACSTPIMDPANADPQPMTHRLDMNGTVQVPSTSASRSLLPVVTMPLAPEAFEAATDLAGSILTANQHPLLCYHGFSSTSQPDLPTPRDVIADVNKRYQNKPPFPTASDSGTFARTSYPEPCEAFGRLASPDAPFDVEMRDNGLLFDFYAMD